ncbi:hypothetical protein [Pontibacter sp. BAB1700]|uniref:hypothetical protein n=1 Tax=Pontibacter sp. BAB1700 TaxID=1144253 RepID=UPI00026BE42C|nr:hypothetical protein [Pontibacter sp. BAB1700]EJF08884.1 hypothetical protein O71_18251 [Pontibacter sp. BAB1700]
MRVQGNIAFEVEGLKEFMDETFELAIQEENQNFPDDIEYSFSYDAEDNLFTFVIGEEGWYKRLVIANQELKGILLKYIEGEWGDYCEEPNYYVIYVRPDLEKFIQGLFQCIDNSTYMRKLKIERLLRSTSGS